MADQKKKKFNKKIIIMVIIAIIVIIAIVLASQGVGGRVDPKLKEVAATRQDIVTHFNFSGNVESHNTQYVQAKTSDSISRLYVSEGDKVQKGDLLYEVDSAFDYSKHSITQASASLSTAQTNLKSSQLNLERIEKLYEAGGIPLVDLERARNDLAVSQNQVVQAQASLNQARDQAKDQGKDTKMYAEIDGEVSKIHVKENESIIMGTNIMDIVDFDNLEVKVKVDEFDLASIGVGKQVDVAIEALNKTLRGTISEIAREASVEMGVSYFLTTVVLPQDSDLRIGLSAEIMVETQKAENVIAVPVSCVSFSGQDAFVQYYNNEGKIEMKPVTIGINDGKIIEIKEGIVEGEKVLTVMTGLSDMERMMMGPSED